MADQMKMEHVKPVYMVDTKQKTGTCVCLINDQHRDCRSLISYLNACHSFTLDHIKQNIQFVYKAKIIYISGYFMISNPKSTFFLAEYTDNAFECLFTMNLSAPYVTRNHSKTLLQLLPFVRILFGNKKEAEILAWTEDPETEQLNIEGIMKWIAQRMMRQTRNGKNNGPKMIIITQGPNDVLVATWKNQENGNGKENCQQIQPEIDYKLEIKRFPVKKLSVGDIKDTNGSGDAFVGGFLANYLKRKSLEECVLQAINAAQMVCQQIGVTLPKKHLSSNFKEVYKN